MAPTSMLIESKQTHYVTFKNPDNIDYNLIIHIQTSLQKEKEMTPETLYINAKEKRQRLHFY